MVWVFGQGYCPRRVKDMKTNKFERSTILKQFNAASTTTYKRQQVFREVQDSKTTKELYDKSQKQACPVTPTTNNEEYVGRKTLEVEDKGISRTCLVTSNNQQ